MAITEKRQMKRLAGTHRDQILLEQVRQTYKLAPLGFLATLVNALIVFFVMKDVIRPGQLVPWLVAVLTITALRMGLVLWFRKTDPGPDAAQVWSRYFLVSLSIVGLAWGSIGLVSFSRLTLAHQVFLAFVLGGMAAGASSTFSMLKPGFLAYAVPALLPLNIHFFLIRDAFHYAMGVMIFLFMILLWRISRHNHAINSTSLRLRFENIDMINTLRDANERVESLNAGMAAEIAAKHEAEAQLLAQHNQLERIVEERTSDLLITNEQLLLAKKAAEAANVAKGEFLVNMSHEMRTPLAGALGMIDLVLEMKIGDEERQLLQMARRSGESLLRIISDVLDFSRLEAGVMRFEEEACQISEIVTTAVEVVSLTAAEKGLVLNWHVDKSVPGSIIGDRGRLRQVLVNLLGNSVKFTETGRIDVEVRLIGAKDPERRFLLFSVKDTGIGIPPLELERVFGKFTQIDSSLTRRHGGTGLGLALTREIIQRWGGTIWAESELGTGSTFYFTLPIT